MDRDKIRLNFLEITPDEFSFIIYRKIHNGEEVSDNLYKCRLPKQENDEEYSDYLVSFENTEGFEEYFCNSFTNTDLTLKIIYNEFIKKIKETNLKIDLENKFHERKVDFITKTNDKGQERISLNTYYLRQEKKFGFLIEFHFKVNEGTKLDKQILQYSLALSSDGRSNKNYYSDNYHKIQHFIQNDFSKIQEFRIGLHTLIIKDTLLKLNARLLNRKVYRFRNDQTDTNQFSGIRKYGAYEEVNRPVKYVFIFEDKFRSFANNLYFSLSGKTNPGTFPGMKQMFGLNFETSDVFRVNLFDYEKQTILNAVEQVIAYKKQFPDHKIITIFLEPDKFDNKEPSESPYYIIKYYLTKENIPTQVIRDDQTNNANALKWSSSNIGLQIFSKLGGVPWKLKPSQSECLILGIGSSYERKEDGSIKKFFAYSVCLDSTGIYKKLDILAEETSKERYLEKLGKNLIELFKNPEFSSYKKCALHISESVKKDAITSIQKALESIAYIEFKVLKVNIHNKFFGYSEHNTFVPYESSYIKLATNEYLVWFDGLILGKENVSQKVANPIHIKFLHVENTSTNNDIDYLQDIINLSGANWRGFNAKQMPISIYYAKIVADYTAAFSYFEDFHKDTLANNLPWFL